MTTLTTEDCLEYGRPDSPCRGPVEYHSVDPGRSTAVPRCSKHWNERLERYDNSIERWANSDVEPAWFSPADAGERWHEDY